MIENIFGRNLFIGSNLCDTTSSGQCVKQPLFAKQRLASKSIATLRSSHLDIPSIPAMSPLARLQMLLGGVHLGKKVRFTSSQNSIRSAHCCLEMAYPCRVFPAQDNAKWYELDFHFALYG